MNIWLKSLLTGLITVALVFFIYKKFTTVKRKSLFTVHYIMEITPEKVFAGQSKEDSMESLNKLPAIIKRRCEAAGYSAAIRIVEKNTKLDINIQHVDDTLYAFYIITRNNKLEFRELYTLNEIPSFPVVGDKVARQYLPQPPQSPPAKKSNDSDKTVNINELIEINKEKEQFANSGIDSFITFNNINSENSGAVSSPPEIGSVNENDTALLDKIIIDNPELLQVLPYDIKFCYGPATDLSKANGTNIFYLYATRANSQETELGNNDIQRAAQDYDQSGRPEITFQFNPVGARKWERMTRNNIGRCIAIILDNSVVSVPRVNDAITGGSSKISGAFTVDEALTLAAQLNSGNIPAKLNIINQDVSPEKTGNRGIPLLIILLSFVIASGLAWLIFNTLKNS
jgi:SecD/SecF fusion protein